MVDLFPLEDFDDWAATYDQTVSGNQQFPFAGYEAVLEKAVWLADVQPGLCVLDLGTGTGNLALRFAERGCELWCTDFSPAMLAKARLKLPQAILVQADLRGTWPVELERRFDRIISAYTFHHFESSAKVHLIQQMIAKRLVPGGWLVIADIAFPTPMAMEAVRNSVGEEWEEEYYWITSEIVPLLDQAGLKSEYSQVSSCGGVFKIWLEQGIL